MKTQIIIILMALLCSNAIAQKNFETNTKVLENKKLSLDFDFADNINISSWDKNEVKIIASVNIDDNKYNDHFRIESNQVGSTIIIKSEIEDMNKLGTRQIVTSKDGDTIRSETHLEINIDYTVYMPSSLNLKIKTINGDISMKEVESEAELKTISGDIDVYWPKNKGTDIELKTISGDMYTDFDLSENKKKGMHCFLPSKYIGKINNGGINLTLETISGNIYLRKK